MNHLAKKLILVMKDCSYIQKNATNSAQKYNYASASAVLEKVNAALSAHGIATLCQTELLSDLLQEQNGKSVHYVTVKTTITLFDGESDPLTICGLGSGLDYGDKAIAKAQTMAIKYAWMNCLNISTGDDPEADETIEESYRRPIHTEQRYEPNESHDEAPMSYGSSSKRAVQQFIERYNQAQNKNETYAIFTESRPLWDSFTKEERAMIMDASSKAKQRLGIEVKNGKN